MDGHVLKFDRRNGYGFIKPLLGHLGSADVFFHSSSLVDVSAPPVGARVSFQLIDSNRGPQACDVRVYPVKGSELYPGQTQNKFDRPRNQYKGTDSEPKPKPHDPRVNRT